MRSLKRVISQSSLATLVSRRGAGAAVTAAAALLGAALLPATAQAASGGPAAGAISAGGGCHYQLVNGGYQFVCTDTTGTGGQPGSGGSGGGGGGAKSACTLTALSEQQAKFLGLAWPAPKGHTWEAITCPGGQPFGGVTLVNNATGAPAVTPQELSIIAIGELIIPDLQPHTAPPLGQDGLVGLPEWFWIPRAVWGPVTRTVTAGPVWARAVAMPEKVVFNPGGGQAGVTCDGPGTAYQPALPAGAQHTDCSYTYDQPSAGQPGNAYAASVTVLWNVFWVGSGGTGGTVANGRPVNTPVTLRVAAGEALVTGG